MQKVYNILVRAALYLRTSSADFTWICYNRDNVVTGLQISFQETGTLTLCGIKYVGIGNTQTVRGTRSGVGNAAQPGGITLRRRHRAKKA